MIIVISSIYLHISVFYLLIMCHLKERLIKFVLLVEGLPQVCVHISCDYRFFCFFRDIYVCVLLVLYFVIL